MATIKHRRATKAQWASSNPVLAAGEIGLEVDTNKFKFGNGVSNWSEQPYFVDERSLDGEDGSAEESKAGRELVAASRKSQFSWSGQNWVDVEGLQLRLSTTDGPAYIFLNLGLAVVNGTVDTPLAYRILDATDQRAIAYTSFNVLGRAEGFNSTLFPLLSGRIPNGTQDHRFVAQVQATGGYETAYIVPDWLPDSSADLYVIGA